MMIDRKERHHATRSQNMDAAGSFDTLGVVLDRVVGKLRTDMELQMVQMCSGEPNIGSSWPLQRLQKRIGPPERSTPEGAGKFREESPKEGCPEGLVDGTMAETG